MIFFFCPTEACLVILFSLLALIEDEFDQVDKPGAERLRRRRTANDEWDR